MARVDTNTLSISKEIACTDGVQRRVAILTGAVAGAAIGIAHFREGGAVWVSILWGLVNMAIFTPVAIYGLAQGTVFERLTATPRPVRSPAALQSLFKRVRVATWFMVAASLALSLYVILR